MISRPEAEGGSSRSWRWPVILIGMLSVHVVFLTWVAIVASSDRSFAIEPDYYAKAVAWDDQRAQIDTNERLGWTARAMVGPPTGLFGDRLLDYRIADGNGTPLVGATVTAEVFHHARGNERHELSLPETAPGRYGRAAPMRRDGTWEIRLVVVRGDERFTHTETIQVDGERR